MICKYFFVLVFFVFSQSAFSAPYESPKFDREKLRKEYLEKIESRPKQELTITVSSDSSKNKFVQFFQDKIWPKLSELKESENLYEMWMVVYDLAYYNDQAEADRWQKLSEEAQNRRDAILADPQWLNDVKLWGQMAQGLSGELPKFALNLNFETELDSYPPEALPKLERLNQLDSEIRKIQNGSILIKGLAANAKANADTIEAYFKAELSWNSATKKLEALLPSGRTALGQDVATRGRSLFQEAAVIRTQIAQQKGFKTWTRLIHARQSLRFAEGIRTTDEKIKFLEEVLKVTEAPYRALLEKRLKEVPKIFFRTKLKDLKLVQLEFLKIEASTLLRKYFPKENIQAVVDQTMRENGLADEVSASIYSDNEPREKKQSHAYMANLISRKPKKVVVDADKLTIEGFNWDIGWRVLNQNIRDDGIDGIETIFHEKGHGRDYAQRANIFPILEEKEASTAWNETHSMQNEQYTQDVDWLMEYGLSRDGEKLSRETVERAVMGMTLNKLFDFRKNVANSIFDIKVWDIDYTKSSEDYVDVATKLAAETMQKATFVEQGIINGVDTRYRVFATGHFYGAQVRYIGYVLASVAARMGVDRLLNIFGSDPKNGRRTFLRQPTLEPLLNEAYFKTGFAEEFPKPIERFTGKKYSPDSVLSGFVDATDAYQPNPSGVCELMLKAVKRVINKIY